MTPLFISALACAFALAGQPAQPAPSKDRPKMGDGIALYCPMHLKVYLGSPTTKAELKITRQQDAAVQEIVRKLREKSPFRPLPDAKLSESEKAVHNRRLDLAESEELLKALVPTLTAEQVKRLKQITAQLYGSELFTFPEVRTALKLGDAQAAELKAIYKKLRDDIGKEAGAGKLNAVEIDKHMRPIIRSVPPQVRAALSPEQQKALNDLLGPPFDFWK